jgi:hypothetical protein
VHGSSSKEIGKLERKLEKQNKFIAEMAQVLSTYDSEVKTRDERRRIHEISRQRDFEGVEDPEERRAIARDINKKGKMRESWIEEQMSSSLALRLVPPRRGK